jgi:hypothetical protein
MTILSFPSSTYTPNEEPDMTPELAAEMKLYSAWQEVLDLQTLNPKHFGERAYGDVILMIEVLTKLADDLKPKSKWGFTFNRFKRNI